MNKADLVRALAQIIGQRRDAQKAVDRFIAALRDGVRRGDKVLLNGFGSFHPRIRKAQSRRNPKTGAAVYVPARRTVKFVPSPGLFK